MELLQLLYPEVSVHLIRVSLTTMYMVFVYYFVNVSFHLRVILYTYETASLETLHYN